MIPGEFDGWEDAGTDKSVWSPDHVWQVGDEEFTEAEFLAGALRWPSPEESRAIVRDLIEQVGPTGLEGGPLPDDPDEGQED